MWIMMKWTISVHLQVQGGGLHHLEELDPLFAFNFTEFASLFRNSLRSSGTAFDDATESYRAVALASSLVEGSSASHSSLHRCTRSPGQHTWNFAVRSRESPATRDGSTSPCAMLGEWLSPWSACLAQWNNTTEGNMPERQ
jgi:hypothetical protein